MTKFPEKHTQNISKNRFNNNFLTGNLNFESAFEKSLNSPWLIHKLIPDMCQFFALYGAPASYKSFIALDIALSVACGIHYHELKNKKKACFLRCSRGSSRYFETYQSLENF